MQSSQELQRKLKLFEAHFDGLRVKNKIPGMSVAVVKDQQVVYAKGFGYSDDEDDRPTTPETSYWIASVTKPFTAAVFMKLAEAGKIDLDFKMSASRDYAGWCERFTRFDSVFTKGFDCKAPITVRNVLSHTVNGTPGERFLYNPLVFSRLSRVVPVVSKKTFAELLDELVLNPARMTDTATSWYDRNKSHVLTNLAQPRRLNAGGELVNSPNPDWDLAGGAGVISTVLDLAKFDIALDRNLIVSEKSRQQMFSPTTSTAGQPLAYGIGWYVQNYKGTKLVWHSGWEPDAYSALLLKVPEKAITLIILANSEGVRWENALDKAEVERSPFASTFLELFL